MNLKIALVGDYNHEVTAHRAIPVALEMAGKLLGITVSAVWLPTDSIGPNFDFSGFKLSMPMLLAACESFVKYPTWYGEPFMNWVELLSKYFCCNDGALNPVCPEILQLILLFNFKSEASLKVTVLPKSE